MRWQGITIGVVSSVIVIFVIYVLFSNMGVQPQIFTPRLEIIDLDSTRNSGFFSDDISIFGRVVNTGQGATNPVTLTITVSDENGAILYTTSTSPQPSIIQPGQESAFVKHFTGDDLGGHRGSFQYVVEVTNY